MKISLYSVVWKLPFKINSLLLFLFLIIASIKTNLCNCKWKELISITSWNLKLPIRLERFIFTQILSLFQRPKLVHFEVRLILWPFIIVLHQEVRKTLWRLHNSDKTCFWSIIHTNRDKTITFSRAVRFDSFPRYNRHRIEMIKPAGRHRLTYNISRTYAVRNDWPIQLIYRIKRSFGSINLLEESSKPEQKTFTDTPVADTFGILFEP